MRTAALRRMLRPLGLGGREATTANAGSSATALYTTTAAAAASTGSSSDLSSLGPVLPLLANEALHNQNSFTTGSFTALSSRTFSTASTLTARAKETFVDGPVRLSFRLWQALLGGLLALATSASAVVFAMPTLGLSAVDPSSSSSPGAAATRVTPSSANISFHPSRRQKKASSSPSSDSSASAASASVPKKPYDVSVRAIRGGRFTMEDEYYVGNGGRFAAVYDGHGGSGVSQFLKRNLYTDLTLSLEQKHWEERDYDDDNAENNTSSSQSSSSKNSPRTSPMDQSGGKHPIPSVSAYVSALRAAFEQVERDVVSDDGLAHQGSTAVAVVLHESEEGQRTLLSANVGDSRAVLSRNGVAVDLTRDHKPNDEKEKARILALGESLEWDQDCKVHRIRNLSLARAIGDRYAKPAVSPEVEIKHFPVSEGEDEFIVLASDGLWDVMTSQEVVAYVHNEMNKALSKAGKDHAESYKLVLRRTMAKFLAREAIRKGSSDNVTVLMVWL